MSAATLPSTARASARVEGGRLEVALEGAWSLNARRPSWAEVVGDPSPRPSQVRVTAEGVSSWDSSLLLFLTQAIDWCRREHVVCDLDALPPKIRRLSARFEQTPETILPIDRSHSLVRTVGLSTQYAFRQVGDILQFVGECCLAAVRLVFHPWRFRWLDCIGEMQQCGAMALPIVSVISFLVGVTLAYSGAVVLRKFGGDIYVADLIGVAMTREMGAVMTAVVLAGRTGAAFAAEIGNMKANEEIDALSTFGISAVRFLVLPRVLALGLMMPLLTLYGTALGILGGMIVAHGVLDIPAAAYWVEMLTIVDLPDVAVGLIKAVAFGLLVGFSGCLRGLQADRNAAGVGRAATSAVVTAILLIVTADALFAVLFEIVGL